MRYAKLENGALVLAANPITVETSRIGNPPGSVLSSLGYKPIRESHFPAEPAPDGFHWEIQWREEAEAIIQDWVQLPLSPDEELSGEETLDILLGGEME